MSRGDHGVLVVDKPAGATSHDVVQWVRWALRERTIGHCGTLDPAATGVLVVCVGEATKLVEHLHAADKRYRALVELGLATTTGDAEGEPLERVSLDEHGRTDAMARAQAAALGLRGALSLAPPSFSAIKQDGVAAHVRARRGEHVELEPRPMRIDEVVVHGVDPTTARIDVELAVGKGTYVRAWAVALGDAVGLPAHLVSLRRLASGDITLAHPQRVHGLEVQPRPARSPMGKPKVAIDLGGRDRDAVAALLRAAMIEPIHALPSAWTRALAPDPERFERLCQGLPQWAISVGVPAEAPEGLAAVTDPGARRLVLARLGPEDGYLRVFPSRVLHLAVPGAAPPAGA